jgi:hypothetical protein
MDKKFHINSNGDVKVCAATKNACQFGDGSLHFTDASEARKVAEQILSTANGNAKVLDGKKRSLQDLKIKALGGNPDQLKNLGPKPAKAPVKSFDSRESAFIKENSLGSFREVYPESAPREVRQLFRNSFNSGDVLRTLLKDTSGNYKAISYNRAKDTFSSWTAPATKDVPIRMEVVGGWNMSVHPNGPKIQFQCGQCNTRSQERLGNFPYRRQGDFRIRCRYCGQLGTVPLQYN